MSNGSKIIVEASTQPVKDVPWNCQIAQIVYKIVFKLLKNKFINKLKLTCNYLFKSFTNLLLILPAHLFIVNWFIVNLFIKQSYFRHWGHIFLLKYSERTIWYEFQVYNIVIQYVYALEVITLINLVTIYHCKSHWLYSLCCTLHALDLFTL